MEQTFIELTKHELFLVTPVQGEPGSFEATAVVGVSFCEGVFRPIVIKDDGFLLYEPGAVEGVELTMDLEHWANERGFTVAQG